MQIIIDMGLDQYAYKIKKGLVEDTIDIKLWDEEKGEPLHEYDSDFFYWRKHHDLQGFMENLYHERGGKKVFNCVCIKLDDKDLDDLENAVKNGKLPETTGFFFGSDNTKYHLKDDLEFIQASRKAIKEGYDILYSSWW